jgi:hypothetical protein
MSFVNTGALRNRQQLAQRQARLYQHHMEQGYPRDVCLEARVTGQLNEDIKKSFIELSPIFNNSPSK